MGAIQTILLLHRQELGFFISRGAMVEGGAGYGTLLELVRVGYALAGNSGVSSG